MSKQLFLEFSGFPFQSGQLFWQARIEIEYESIRNFSELQKQLNQFMIFF
jgi:hypothetical protein